MFLRIENFLNPAEITSVAQIARQSKFVDGKLSNPHNILKQNVIADPGDVRGAKGVADRSSLCNAARRLGILFFRAG
jgi:hypothetical protein